MLDQLNSADPRRLAYVGSQNGHTVKPTEMTALTSPRLRDSDAWFTPKALLQDVRLALGGSIDFDPFSSASANERVLADRYYTIEDNALVKPWPEVDTVFMNPPYSRGLVDQAAATFLRHYEARAFRRGIVLVNNATETKWFQALLEASRRVCIFAGRINFENVDGKAVSGNTRGQALLYFNSNPRAPRQIAMFDRFNKDGIVLRRSV